MSHVTGFWVRIPSMGWLLLYGGLTLFWIPYGVMNPDRAVIALAFFTIGLAGTWKHYLAWRARNESRRRRPAHRY